MNKKEVHVAFSREALFAKSRVFIQRGYRADEAGQLDEYQLWASLALELLGKSTLSSFHPSLVAEPNCESLFAACGLQKTVDVKSIAAKTLFSRLSKLSKKFDKHIAKFCEDLSARRNSELHSGETPFVGMNQNTWEAQFWLAISTLLEMQEKDLKDWLRSDTDAEDKAQLLHDAEEARKKAVTGKIANYRSDFHKRDSAERKKLVANSHSVSPWAYVKSLDSSIEIFESEECPACAASGVVGGVLWDEQVVQQDWESLGDEIPEETVDRHFVSEEFWCPVCKLHLNGVREIEAAGLVTEFSETVVREMEYEPDYGND